MDELKKDHDILVTLVANLNNLKESQETFHREVKESFKSLENNYSGRIDGLDTRTKRLETKNTWYSGALAVIGICSSLVIYIYFSQQEIQNLQIEQIVEIQRQLLDKHSI